MISVDLDRASTLHLLRTYLSVPQAFSVVTGRRLTAAYDVFTSPSGVGYHIKILTAVTTEEDLKIRALLWDDPVRLAYAMKRWALSQGQEKYVDLCFDEKNAGLERCINMRAILHPFQSQMIKVRELLQSGESEKAEDIVHKVAKSIDPAIQGGKKKQFVGCIAFSGDLIREQLEKICGEIAAKDETFKWRMYPCFFPEFEWILSVFTDDKNLAWKRITWIKNKASKKEDEKLVPILKDAETRLWVKERIAT